MDFKCQLKFRMKYPGYSSSYFFHVTSPDSAVEEETWTLLTVTGKSLSEALIFASTNQQYDNRLFIKLQVQYMKIPSSNLGRTCCVQKLFFTFRTIYVYNMFATGSELGIFMYWTCNSMNNHCHIVG